MIMANKSHKLTTILVPLVSMLLAGCAAIDIETGFQPDISIHDQIIDQTEDRFAHIDPLYISDEVKEMIDGYVSQFDTPYEQVRKLQDILYNEEFLYIQYDDSVTHLSLIHI